MPEHILSAACWCNPIMLTYGAEPVYDEQGDMVAVEYPDEDEEG